MTAAIDLTARVHLRVLTNSEIKTFRRCPREHHYAYRLGYRPAVDAHPLRFGTAWHLMQESYWHDRDLNRALTLAGANVDPFDTAHLRALMRGYHVRWEGAPFGVINVEAQFRAPLINPHTKRASRTFEMGGKVDALVVNDDDRKFLVEHKTTSKSLEPGGNYWRALNLDGQPCTYIEGVRSLGHEVDGVLYDVVRKLALRPLEANARRAQPETAEAYEQRCMDAIAEDPAKYYARGMVVRLGSEEDEARSDRWQVAQAIQLADKSGHHARNVDACERFGRMCPYWDVCCGTASLEDPTRFRRVTEMHEELQETGT